MPQPAVEGQYVDPVVVSPTHVQVRFWRETNGLAGLQRVACVEGGVVVPRDAPDGATVVDGSGVVGVSGGCLLVAGSRLCVL